MANRIEGGQQLPWYKSNVAVGLAGAALTVLFAATAGVGGASLFQHLHHTTNGVLEFIAKIPENYAIGMTAGGGVLALAAIGGASGIFIHRKVEKKPEAELPTEYAKRAEDLSPGEMRAFMRYSSGTADDFTDGFIVRMTEDYYVILDKNITIDDLDQAIQDLQAENYTLVGPKTGVIIADDQ